MEIRIDRAVSFIAESDPRFPEQIRGATGEEIDRLETAIGRPLPGVYRRYLERMGRGMDWLKIADARFDVDSLVRYYENLPGRDPEGYLLIGRSNGDPYYDVYLWQESEDQLRVVSFPPPPSRGFEEFARINLKVVAGSLPQLLCDAALRVSRFHLLPYRRQVESSAVLGRPTALRQLDSILAEKELLPLWYSNDWMRTYDSGKDIVTAYESARSGRLIVDVLAGSQEEIDEIYPAVRALVKGL
jgi:hypothetical protein